MLSGLYHHNLLMLSIPRYDPAEAYRNQYTNTEGVGSKVLAHETINTSYASKLDNNMRQMY